MTHPLEEALCRNYRAPGPVAQAFINDVTHRLVGIMGPNGSGKTSSCPVKAQLITRLQPRNRHDGVIRSQGYVIRPTYPDLWGKTIPQWLKVFPNWKDWPLIGSQNRPAKQVVSWADRLTRTGADGQVETYNQRYEMIVNFVAIVDANLEDFARGLLATWIWLNEADTMPAEAVDFFLGRLGRYPEPDMVEDDARAGFGCVMCDFNAPNSTNWTYRRVLMGKLLSGRASNAKCYVQPSGLAPNAENPAMRKLNPNYYVDTATGLEDWQRKRFIENKPGYARTGEPVYGNEWDYETFVLAEGRERQYSRGSPLLIGVDGKLNAAAVIGQCDWRRQLTVLRSLVTPNGSVTDARSFGKALKELLAGEFPGCPAVAMIDPANWYQRSAEVKDTRSWGVEFAEEAGIPVYPAPTNDLQRRHGAVRSKLKGRVGAEPSLLINETGNEILIDGFVASYQVRKLKQREDPKYPDQPDKGHASHVHDAMQYLAFLAGGDPAFVDQAIMLQAQILEEQKRLKLGGGPAVAPLNDW